MLIELIDGPRKKRRPAVCRPVLGVIERGSTRPPAPTSNLIERAIAFMEKEAVTGIRPRDVARHLNVSRRLLDLRFKQFESKSIAERILDCRLDSVQMLLKQTDRPVKNILARCGFGNVPYATRLFKKRTGLPPESWRRSHGLPSEPSAAERKPNGVERVLSLSDADADALIRLSRQLTEEAQFDRDALSQAIRQGGTLLFVLRRRGEIVASASVARFQTPTGAHHRLEDVVVDTSCRGHGLGRKLVKGTLDAIRELGVTALDLTSHPSRVAANALYRSFGFTQRETNVYECRL